VASLSYFACNVHPPATDQLKQADENVACCMMNDNQC